MTIVELSVNTIDDPDWLRASIMNQLAKVPKDVVEGYCDGMVEGVSAILSMREAVSLHGEPTVLVCVLEKMSAIQLKNLATVVGILSSHAVDKRVQDLVDATLGTSPITEQAVEKASALVAMIKVLREQGVTFEDLASQARLRQILGCSLLIMSEVFERILLTRFSNAPIDELDQLLALANNLSCK